MKKLISIMGAIIMSISMMNSAFAVDDIMTPVNENERGASIPSYDSTWNLSKPYLGSFDFDSSVYTNYCFTGADTISVYVSSKSDSPTHINKTFTTGLYQKKIFGDSFVSSFTCKRDGVTSGKFNVKASNRYYVRLSKSTDGVWLNGTINVS